MRFADLFGDGTGWLEQASTGERSKGEHPFRDVKMDWKEVTVRTTTEGADIVSELLIEAGAAGTAIADRAEVEGQQRLPRDWDYIDENILKNMDEDVLVQAWYPMDGRLPDTLVHLRQRLDALAALGLEFPLGKLTLSTDDVKDEDWENNWKQYYKPFPVGEKLMVRPVWEPSAPNGRLELIMEPGMAFGTGTHETTFMCMELLEKAVRPGDLVWDIGCGTGILSVAAALLGASSVVAVDRDPVAVSAARINCDLNAAGKAVTVREGDLTRGLEGTPNIIVANILAEVVAAMAPEAFAHLAPDGCFVCSGIILAREELVREALGAAGFTIEDGRRMGEWAALLARKP